MSKNWRDLTWLRCIISALLILAVAAACDPFDDSDEDSSGNPGEELTAEELIDRAVTRWNEMETAHFNLGVDGANYLDDDETIELTSAAGNLKRPQSVEATAQIGLGMVNLDVSLIFIGDDAYMTDFLTGSWGPAPDDFSYNPSLLLSTTDGLGPVLEQMQDPQIVGTEQIDGREAVHLRGSVTEEMIDELTAGTINGEQIAVDIWFDSQTYDALRLVLAEPEGESENPAVWTINFSAHDEPVEIEAPSV